MPDQPLPGTPGDPPPGRSPRPGPRGFELGTDGPSAILVGVDASPTSLRAAAFALGQARRQHARLVIAYVRERMPTLAALGTTAGSGDVLTAAYGMQDDVERELRTSFDTVVRPSGVDATLVVRTGDPYHELTALAREIGADGIVVGASTRAGHRIAGSLAVRLVRNGHWPVTVVP